MRNIFVLTALAISLTACVSAKTQVVYEGQEYAVSRTALEKMTDFSIEREIIKNINQITGIEDGNHRVGINSFRGDVLLTGEVPSDAIKTEIEQITKSIRQVDSVYNYLTVGEPKSQSHTLQEQYLKTKVDAKLLLKQKENITPSQYLVVVRDDMAYIMGVMTKAQQEEIIQTAYTVDGVRSVSLVNSLVQFNFDGTSITSSNMTGDLSQVNPNNRLIPLPNQNIQTPNTQNAQKTNAQTATVANTQNIAQTDIKATKQNNTAPITMVTNTANTAINSVNKNAVTAVTKADNTVPKPTTQTPTTNQIKSSTPAQNTTVKTVPLVNPANQVTTDTKVTNNNGTMTNNMQNIQNYYGANPNNTTPTINPQNPIKNYVDLYKNSTTP